MEFCISGKKVSTEMGEPSVKTGGKDNELQIGNPAGPEQAAPARTGRIFKGAANPRFVNQFVNHLDSSVLTNYCRKD